MKWFDLKAENSKLERVEAGPGRFALQLTIDNDRLASLGADPEEIERQGWIGDPSEDAIGQTQFLNHRSVLSARDVAGTLTAFFPKNVVEANYVDMDRLSQGEVVDGLKDRATAKPDDFLGEMDGVAQSDLNRIRASIVKAQQFTKDLEQKRLKQPLDGQGFAFLQFMASKNEPELGAAAILEAVRSKMPKLEAAIVGFDGSDRDVVEDVRALVHDARVESVREFILESTRQAEIMSGQTPEKGELAALYLRHQVPVLALEPASTTPADDSLKAINMQVRSDKSLSDMEYSNALAATRKSLVALGQILNRDPDDLFPNQAGSVLRIARVSTSTDKMVMGQAAGMGKAEDDIGSVESVAVSASRGSSIIHEVGHTLHNAYGVTDVEMRALLEETGVRGRVIRAVREDLEKGLLSPDQAEYLMSDKEIWARSVEATAVNRALASGDKALTSIGGFTAAHPADTYAPTGDNNLTETFARKLTTLLDEKLSALQEMRPLERMQP